MMKRCLVWIEVGNFIDNKYLKEYDTLQSLLYPDKPKKANYVNILNIESHIKNALTRWALNNYKNKIRVDEISEISRIFLLLDNIHPPKNCNEVRHVKTIYSRTEQY